MTKILVVDDERSFRWWTNTEPRYARTIEEARTLIFGQHWDEVWLDHDMGNGHDGIELTKEIEANGYDIAGNIAKDRTLIVDVDQFIIHSMNPIGREAMYLCLYKWYNVRFATVSEFRRLEG